MRMDNIGHLITAAACGLALTIASPGKAAAQTAATPAVEALGIADLEKAFWICDYRATKYGVEATPVALCSAAFDALRDQKFGGDFGELLAWWRANKLVQHTSLGADE